ncbi:hypothetical protein LOZ58_003204 [Ophidiomyces ophidiicola]|nr:hypothetical protein LOZ65_002499 [Ophidiomyces ophidiicola]KAI1961350.1 hypothetical protein LOZ58_003204 [Ophidiomyces ophidiicola]
MPLSSSSTSISLSRYRSALYIATGLAAAYAFILIRRHLNHPPSSGNTGLQRQNAVRRRPSRRWERPLSWPHSSADVSMSFEPVQKLREMEAEATPYGMFFISVGESHTYQCPLLPSALPSIEELEESMDVDPDRAVRVRALIEDAFLDSFFALEYPKSHVILESTGERQYLIQSLLNLGFTRSTVLAAIDSFNADPNFGEGLRERRLQDGRMDMAIDGNTLERRRNQEAQSLFSWREANEDTAQPREGQNLLNLLYHIAEDQAKRDGFIHRGITCDGCGVAPIQGIRYRCANCPDFDLCETCEAMDGHFKTHVFYKIRIPGPVISYLRPLQQVWYPGNPSMAKDTLSRSLVRRLAAETGFENTEVDAFWEQFKCLASSNWQTDPNNLKVAIDRRTFNQCFIPSASAAGPSPNLLYDRMFSFYDSNGDNLIGFEEFVKGIASLCSGNSHERLRRTFLGYDIDGDGYVERKDFLRIFRAYYSYSKELSKDTVVGLGDAFFGETARHVVLGNQSISAAFHDDLPEGETSRNIQGKRRNVYGDDEIDDNQGVIRDEDERICQREEIIGDAIVRETFGTSRPSIPLSHSPNEEPQDSDDNEHEDEEDYLSLLNENRIAAENVTSQDIISALGAYIPFDEVTDRVDRARILTCVSERHDLERINRIRRNGLEERWERRQFYTDEEEGAAPPAHLDEEDKQSEDIEPEDHVTSNRSRSSSKVRFQDDVTDNEYETRSNLSTSSRSIPVGERWGGFEIPEPEKDVGKEILYQVTQQGLNELLDMLFRPKEDLLMEAHRTRVDRQKWAREIDHFAMSYFGPAAVYENKTEPRSIFDDGGHLTYIPREQSLEQLLGESGYSYAAPEPISSGRDKSLQQFLDELEYPSVFLPISFQRQKSLQQLLDESCYSLAPSPNQTPPDSRPRDYNTSPSHHANETPPPHPASCSISPSPQTLMRWCLLNNVEREAKARGGSGARLDFEEFSERMRDSRGRLAFVSSWVDGARF